MAKLLVMRHGEAEAYRNDDASRQLTTAGQAQVARVAVRCNDYLGDIQEVWCSPYLRTQQTAQILIANASLPDYQITPLLLDTALPTALLAWLSELPVKNRLLVTHQPLISYFIDKLCGLPPRSTLMSTASIALIEVDYFNAGFGSLCWVAHEQA